MKDYPYLRERKGRWFFILGEKRAREAGWFWRSGEDCPPRLYGKPKGSIPLGAAETKNALASIRRQASELYAKFLEDVGAASGPAPEAHEYPGDSLGAWFHAWTHVNERGEGFHDWLSKGERAREDYARAWKHLGPALARRPIHKITPNEFAGHQRQWEKDLSGSERFRTVKCARAIFKAAELHGILAKGASPATVLPNPMPKGRAAYFHALDIYEYALEALAAGKRGLSLIILVAWEGAQAPVDIRTITLDMYHRSPEGRYIHRRRKKTEEKAPSEIYIALSEDTADMIDAYLAHLKDDLNIELTPNAPIFRKAGGRPYLDHKALGQDFRRLRLQYDPSDDRSLMDIRRSANLEMAVGGASDEQRAKILANTLDKNRFLEATYTPPTLALARKMSSTRADGRAHLRNKVETAGVVDLEKLKLSGSSKSGE